MTNIQSHTADTSFRLPPRQSYKPPETSPAQLPFVYYPGRKNRKAKICWWQVPPIADPYHASSLGREYAIHFSQFLRDNPTCAGSGAMINAIRRDMPLDTQLEASTLQNGFWAEIERQLART